MTATTLEDLKAPLKVIFEQRVADLIEVGNKGRVLFCKKNENLTESEGYRLSEFDSAIFELSEEVYGDDCKDLETQIKQVFRGNPLSVVLLEYKTTFASVVKVVKEQLQWDWAFNTDSAAQSDMAALGKEVKKFVLTYNQKADSIYVCSISNPSAKLSGGVQIANSSTIEAEDLLPIVAGVCAGCPYNMSITYKIFDELESVEMPETISEGQIILENTQEGVRVATPVTTLTTTNTQYSEDMKSITIVEGMIRFESDILFAFNNSYKGRYKNKYDNQALLFSAIEGYIRELEELDVLDPEYSNNVNVDIEEQREMWKAAGKDADKWDDLTVKKTTYKNIVNALCDVKFLNAMEGMIMRVKMF